MPRREVRGLPIGRPVVTGYAHSAGGRAVLLGETKPTTHNTGLLEPTSSISTGGNLTFATDDEVIENVRFERRVSVTAKRVTFRNCQFVGAPTWALGSAVGLLQCTNDNVEDLLIEFCEIEPQTHNVWLSGILGHGYTVRGSKIRGVTDALRVQRTTGALGNTIHAEGNLMEFLAYFCPNAEEASPTTDNRSHNDAIQFVGSQSHIGSTVIGNTLRGNVDPAIGNAGQAVVWAGTPCASDRVSGFEYFDLGTWGFSSIQFGTRSGTPVLQDILIDQNWIDGGEVGINGGTWSAGVTNLAITRNRWGRDFYPVALGLCGGHSGAGGPLVGSLSSSATTTGNVFEDNGDPYNTWNNTGWND